MVYEAPHRLAFRSVDRAETRFIPRTERRQVELRAYAVRFDDSIVEMRILDMTYDGCGIETTTKLIPGELLRLSVLGRGVGKATVRWYNNRKAGLLFDSDRQTNVPRDRAAERIEVSAQVSLRRTGKLAYAVRTSDFTRFGCACEFVERPNINERVWVKFEGLEVLQANVRWIAGSSVGLEFGTPLHPAVFELLLRRLVTPPV